MHQGKIVAVCSSPVAGVPKYVQSQVTIAEFGIAGDFHCKPMRRSFSQHGTFKPNIDRHITIVAKEAIDYVNFELNLEPLLIAGSLGENITTEGLGDLFDIQDEAIVFVNGVPVFRVVEQNQPCHNLLPYHKYLAKKIYGRRGLLCAVIGGIGTVIVPGDKITID